MKSENSSNLLHLEEVRKAVKGPLHQKLVDAFIEMAKDPEKGAVDYATGLRAILEETLIKEEIPNALPRSDS
jgi:hypothetical protein